MKTKLLKYFSIACIILFTLGIISAAIKSDTFGLIISSVLVLVLITEIVLLILYFIDKSKNKVKKEKVKTISNKKLIVSKVVVLGVRQGEETGLLVTYNFSVYSLLVMYTNGASEVIECTSDSKEFKKLVQFMSEDDREVYTMDNNG